MWDSGLSKGKYQVLSLKDLEKIHQTAISILGKVGVQVGKEPFLQISSHAGCKVERDSRVKVPRVLSWKRWGEFLVKPSFTVKGRFPLWISASGESIWKRARRSALSWIWEGDQCSLSLGN